MTEKKHRRERWREALHDKATNLQFQSGDEPDQEEGFLTLTLINHKGKMHKFVVSYTLKQLIDRQTKYIEYFSTDTQGRKIGVSLEWRKREEAHRATDKQFQETLRRMTKLVEEQPEITLQDQHIKDFGAGLSDYHE